MGQKRQRGQVKYRRKTCIEREGWRARTAGSVRFGEFRKLTKSKRGIWWSELWEQQWREESKFQVLPCFRETMHLDSVVFFKRRQEM